MLTSFLHSALEFARGLPGNLKLIAGMLVPFVIIVWCDASLRRRLRRHRSNRAPGVAGPA